MIQDLDTPELRELAKGKGLKVTEKTTRSQIVAMLEAESLKLIKELEKVNTDVSVQTIEQAKKIEQSLKKVVIIPLNALEHKSSTFYRAIGVGDKVYQAVFPFNKEVTLPDFVIDNLKEEEYTTFSPELDIFGKPSGANKPIARKRFDIKVVG